MKRICLLTFLTISMLNIIHAQQSLKLWYNKPATQWVEALPLGNGRIGAMIFGGVEEELIQLNESTLYSGGPVKQSINPEAKQYLPAIRKALLQDGDYTKASELTKKMQGYFTESYLPMGDVIIRQQFNGKKAQGYYRDLDISKAVSSTHFTIDNVTYKREAFTSAPGNVMVIRITANAKSAIHFDVATRSQLHYTLSTTANNVYSARKNGDAPSIAQVMCSDDVATKAADIEDVVSHARRNQLSVDRCTSLVTAHLFTARIGNNRSRKHVRCFQICCRSRKTQYA